MSQQITVQVIERFRASARRSASQLQTDFPDFPKATAYAVPAAEEFCIKQFDDVFKAEDAVRTLTTKFHATFDQLLIERKLGRRE